MKTMGSVSEYGMARPYEAVLRAWGWARKHVSLILLLCALVIVGGIWAFAEIADEVLEGDTLAFDTRILRALRSPIDPGRPIGPAVNGSPSNSRRIRSSSAASSATCSRRASATASV